MDQSAHKHHDQDEPVCPSCKSDERGFTRAPDGSKFSGRMYLGSMCLHRWHEYPWLERLASGHYSTRKKKGASK